MTVRFGNNRLAFYTAVIILSGTVLGLAANFASIFLPHLHNNFIIFALVVPSLTIFCFLLSLQWAQPNSEAVLLFTLGVLWLAMGAWATDVIGPLQCDSISSDQTMPAKNGGTTSQRSYCYEMKVIQAFSWALFIMFVFAEWILFQLVNQAEKFGRYTIWREPIRELPWFGEMPGYYNTSTQQGAPGMQYYPSAAGSFGHHGQQYGYPQPMPGHSLVIQPGMNGAPPTITHMPMSNV